MRMGQIHYKVGDRIKRRYRVVSTHQGFLGLVYICKRKAAGEKPVYAAIKTFRSDDRIRRDLFEKELANWVRLTPHPNVVQAIDADTKEKLLVLEFVYGPTLKGVASRSPVHSVHLVPWARQIAAGLRFLHVDNRFVHRDLRPANILIDIRNDLRAKISDLGIGKPLNPDATSHTMIGTHAYMAPEVHQGRTDFRSDIFCYGATIYYLLTGRSVARVTTKRMDTVTSPRHFAPDVSETLERLTLKCVERDPDRRYRSMDEVLEALDDVAEWSMRPVPFEHCSRHAYFYFSGSTGRGCPFCRYERDFESREHELERKRT